MKGTIWSTLVLLLMCIFVLSACNSGDTTPNNDVTNQTGSNSNAEDNNEDDDSSIICQHTFSEWIIDEDATCKEAGSKHKECTKCEEVLETATIDKLTTHTPGEAKTENFVDSTCKVEGSYDDVVYCSVCGVEISRTEKTVEKKTTHTPDEAKTENFVDSDCETEGSYNLVTYCSVCNAKLSTEAKTVEKKPHTSSDWIIDKDATCKETGSKHKECTKCEEVLEIASIDKLTTHSLVTDLRVEPTCTLEGLTEGSHCKVCEQVIVAQEIIRPSHKFSCWQVVIPPEYSYDGIEERVCKCGVREEREVSKTEIDFASYIFDKDKTYEIEFWVKNDTNLKQVNAWIDAAKEFNKLYPNIKINLKNYTDSRRICQDLLTNSNKPDAVVINPSYIFNINNGFDLISFNNLIADTKYGIENSDDELLTHLLSLTRIDENLFALPFMHSSQVCYINKTYVEKLGFEIPEVLTWDFVLEVSEEAIKTNNGNKTIPIACKSSADLVSILLAQNGTYSIFNEEKTNFNDSAILALSYIEDLFRRELLTTFSVSGYPSNLFAKGQCIFAFDSSAQATWFGTDAPNYDVLERVEFETVVKNIPCFDTNDQLNYERGLYICAINSNDADRIFATWLFAKFLLSENVQIAYSKTEGYMPTTSKNINSEQFQNYIDKSGSNNDLYYEVKINAVKELEKSIFDCQLNDSTIEDIYEWLVNQICKDVKRGKTFDDTYYQNLFDTMKSLYGL